MIIKRGERGFTLVELAIVLIIIGILLSLVLKGQELINNAKMKRLYKQYREVMAAVYTYYDRYNAYPGDDPNASKRWPGVPNGNGDGLIGPQLNSQLIFDCGKGDGREACAAWLHMRLANILVGSTDLDRGTIPPTNAYGGRIGIGYATIYGMTTHWIGFENIPADVCTSLEYKYDDGKYDDGSIRGSGDYINNPDKLYDLYIRLE